MSCTHIAPGVARYEDGNIAGFGVAANQGPGVDVEGCWEVSSRVAVGSPPAQAAAQQCWKHQQQIHLRQRQPPQRTMGRKENTASVIYRFPSVQKGSSSGAAMTMINTRKSKPALPFARNRRQRYEQAAATDPTLMSSLSSSSSLSSLSTTSAAATRVCSLSPIIENQTFARTLPSFANDATSVSSTDSIPPASVVCVPLHTHHHAVDPRGDGLTEGGRGGSMRGCRGGDGGGGSCGERLGTKRGASSRGDSGRGRRARDSAGTWDTTTPVGTATAVERGPNGVWRCPSTSSLREEASANLSCMTKPDLWKSRGGAAVREAARAEMASILGRYKALRKRDRKGDFSWALRIEMNEDERERWMKRRALMRPNRFTVQQRRELRKWFDSLDKDGSGEIDALELSHPLLSTGIARSAEEVHQLVKQVDKDGSGEIGFPEFLSILQPRGTNASRAAAEAEAARGGPPAPPMTLSAVNKIVTLQEVQKAHGSDMETVVAIKRRSLLMKEILDEAALRDLARDDVAEKRYVAERDGDRRALQALKARERRLDFRWAKKNLFIQAVSDTTDFTKEREKIDLAVRPGGNRERF